MQLIGRQAIIFGTRIDPEYCLILMKTNFLDICIRFNMFSQIGAKMVPKKGVKGRRAEGRKGLILILRENPHFLFLTTAIRNYTYFRR